jgi:hypothetical protein
MFMSPNDGSGDNVSFSFTGPGVSIPGIGGMGCFFWCSGQPISDPGGGASQVFVSFFNTVILGGISYDPSSLGFSIFPFDESGGLNGFATGFAETTQFNLTLPTNGGWSFDFAPTTDEFGNPAFAFTNGTFFASAPLLTPEPATVGLMLTGLAGIAGRVRRKARLRH